MMLHFAQFLAVVNAVLVVGNVICSVRWLKGLDIFREASRTLDEAISLRIDAEQFTQESRALHASLIHSLVHQEDHEFSQSPVHADRSDMELTVRGTTPAHIRFHPSTREITARVLVWIGDVFGEPDFTDSIRIGAPDFELNLSPEARRDLWLARVDVMAHCLWEKIAPQGMAEGSWYACCSWCGQSFSRDSDEGLKAFMLAHWSVCEHRPKPGSLDEG